MNISQVRHIINEIGIPILRENRSGLNFRCVLCGDSKKSKKKARGWFLTKQNRVSYYCHNCGASYSFKGFLKKHYPILYKKYYTELTKISEALVPSVVEELPQTDDDLVKEDISYVLKDICFPLKRRTKSKVITDLQVRAVIYLLDRKIPSEEIRSLYVSYGNYKKDEDTTYYLNNRIIIPYWCGNKLYAFQARSLQEDTDYKYITIKESNETKIYNLFDVNPNKTVFVTEGPIDSWFVENCIATSGTITPQSPIYRLIKSRFKDVVWVFDNPTVDKDGKKKLEAFLKAGEACYMWDSKWKEAKDPNEVVIKYNITKKEMTENIIENTKKGVAGIVFSKLF